MKKILILVGTRPNFIKITQFEREFAKFPNRFSYLLVHTGQHYDDNMSKIFFDQFNLKKPDYYLNIETLSPTAQIGKIIFSLDEIVREEKPDLILVPGDVNSTLAGAIVANKNGIKLGHIESGLRSYDREMPEEINRILTDEMTDLFFVTEPSGVENLLKEGKSPKAIFHLGNTMIDTLLAFEGQITKSEILEKLQLDSKTFVLMTMHRPRNVDTLESLEICVEIINEITKQFKVVLPIHPRTKHSFIKHGLFDTLQNNQNVILTEALDYLSFQKLISECKFVVTDSGGIQEETTFRQIPCLTLRENTERPVTLTEGSNTLVDYNKDAVKSYIDAICQGNYKKGEIPAFWDGKATERIVKVLNEIL